MSRSQVLTWTIKGLWKTEEPYYGLLVATAGSPYSGKKTACPERGALRCLKRLLSLNDKGVPVQWDSEQLADALKRAQEKDRQEAVALLQAALAA